MKKRIFLSLLLVFAVTICLASCSKEAALDFKKYSPDQAQNGILQDSASGQESAESAQESALTEGRKIIRTFDYQVETKAFDALLESIKKEVAALGGYLEASNVNGNRMDQKHNRYAEITLRIPARQSDSFSSYLSKESVVVSENVRTEDVTKNYVDSESRLSALRSEKEALEEILKKAVSVEEIIAIRTQLTEVIYQIESYESSLRNYDNLIEYCTVNVSVSEVERTTVVEEQSVWNKIGTNLKNNFESVGDGIVAVFVFFISAIPFLLIPCALVLILLIVIRIRTKKRKKAKENEKNA